VSCALTVVCCRTTYNRCFSRKQCAQGTAADTSAARPRHTVLNDVLAELALRGVRGAHLHQTLEAVRKLLQRPLAPGEHLQGA